VNARPGLPPGLAPESRAILERARELGLLDAEADTIAELREQSKRDRVLNAEPPPLPEVRDLDIPGPEGRLPLRLYLQPGRAPSRTIVFFHGGGWVVGDLDGADVDCRCLCLDTGSLVVSVGYRLAPEHPFPAAPSDCYAALDWVARNAATLGAKPGPLVVAGDSAGGNLAAAVALLVRDRGGPALAAQVLIYPVTDCAFDTGSYDAFAVDYWLGRDDMRTFWECYLGAGLEGADDPLASVLRAPDLSGLPHAVVVTAGCDVLRDEGVAYAERLRAAGTPVTALPYDGQIHGFWSCGAVTDLPRKLNARIAAALDGPR
jgi:acetyl esterase